MSFLREKPSTDATPRKIYTPRKPVFPSFPTITEMKNDILDKIEKGTATPDEIKLLGRIKKEAIHLDRFIAKLKEMMKI